MPDDAAQDTGRARRASHLSRRGGLQAEGRRTSSGAEAGAGMRVPVARSRDLDLDVDTTDTYTPHSLAIPSSCSCVRYRLSGSGNRGRVTSSAGLHASHRNVVVCASGHKGDQSCGLDAEQLARVQPTEL